LDPVFAAAKSGVNLNKKPMGPFVGERIVWETTHSAFGEMTWERETIGETPCQRTIHFGIGSNEYSIAGAEKDAATEDEDSDEEEEEVKSEKVKSKKDKSEKSKFEKGKSENGKSEKKNNLKVRLGSDSDSDDSDSDDLDDLDDIRTIGRLLRASEKVKSEKVESKKDKSEKGKSENGKSEMKNKLKVRLGSDSDSDDSDSDDSDDTEDMRTIGLLLRRSTVVRTDSRT
jgi:hypothetical protein